MAILSARRSARIINSRSRELVVLRVAPLRNSLRIEVRCSIQLRDPLGDPVGMLLFLERVLQELCFDQLRRRVRAPYSNGACSGGCQTNSVASASLSTSTTRLRSACCLP